MKSLHSVSASRFSIFLLSRRALRDIKAFLDGSVDPSKHMAQTQTQMHTFAEKNDKIFIVFICALPVDHVNREQVTLFPI